LDPPPDFENVVAPVHPAGIPVGIPTPAGQLAASVVFAGCGGPRHAQSGTISSPLNPDGNYGRSVECVWDISVLPGYHVNIAFDEPFGIEDSANCTNDYLQVAWHRQTWNWVRGSPGQWVIWVIFHVRVTGSSF